MAGDQPQQEERIYGINDFRLEFEVRDYLKELEELEANGVISFEERKWVEEVLKVFTVDPSLLVGWSSKPLPERLKVLGSLKLNVGRVWERWVEERGLDPEKAAGKLPPPGYVAEHVAEAVTRLRLLEPVVAWLGEVSELCVRVRSRLHYEEDFSRCVEKLALSGLPWYTSQQLLPSLYVALRARAKPLPRGLVNPVRLLNCENGVVELETLTFHESVDYVFTYELPPVDPTFLRELREGRVSEAYFVAKPFYAVVRKHYSEGEWLKLKRVLGAVLIPRTMKLIAIIVGPKDTRKTFLYSLLKKTLGGLVAAVRLRDLAENRFALQHAIGARALVASEEAQTVVRYIEKLKSVSGGDPQPVDRKFKPPTTMEDNPLKVLIFTNEIPVFKRWDDSFVDRLVIINTENPEKPSPEEQRSIEEALRRRGDFLEFLLYCYWDLVRSDYEIPEKGSEKYVEILLRAQSNVFAFAEELLEGEVALDGRGVQVLFGRGYSTEGGVLYDIYSEWCRQRGEEPENRNTFYQLIEEALSERGVVKQYARKVMFRGIKVIARPARGEEELPFG